MKLLMWFETGKYWLDEYGATTNVREKAKRFTSAEILHLISTPSIRKSTVVLAAD